MNDNLEKIGNEIISGTKDVFQTMLMVDIQAGDPVLNEKIPVSSNMTSMLGLGGSIKGMLAVHCTEEAAKTATALMLGMDIAEMNEDVKDAVGEIANMVAGNLKISFETFNQEIQLAIPSAIIGNSYKMAGMGGAKRVIIPFVLEENKEFWIELVFIENH